ncbi:hypothetical protein SISNIDRAFT_485767 [Sistotremastrum niveocremeum HHB9708]|uniref:Uncharacterized protein n=1 Tax=Sistotremastrum niveocremeum HHB9708 TaxID=1314777 RepID=A0A164UT92_9AGAM|nr:hypothetical protein SISNIDRAFT_485767 [Sistotremastrum niveocremeum HHB9708]
MGKSSSLLQQIWARRFKKEKEISKYPTERVQQYSPAFGGSTWSTLAGALGHETEPFRASTQLGSPLMYTPLERHLPASHHQENAASAGEVDHTEGDEDKEKGSGKAKGNHGGSAEGGEAGVEDEEDNGSEGSIDTVLDEEREASEEEENVNAVPRTSAIRTQIPHPAYDVSSPYGNPWVLPEDNIGKVLDGGAFYYWDDPARTCNTGGHGNGAP